jgi:hypothetical protein
MKKVITEEIARKTPSPDGVKELVSVYAARRLSANGPASLGYAMHDFYAVQFVDVVAKFNNGRIGICRTLVIATKTGTWYAFPAPHLHPLLAVGLNDESESTVLFSEIYNPKNGSWRGSIARRCCGRCA